MTAVSRNTALISWGEPAQIAESKERCACGRCGAERGFYGQHFGIGYDGNPLPVVEEFAFDITKFEHSIAALCWNCGFSFYQFFEKKYKQVNRKSSKKKVHK